MSQTQRSKSIRRAFAGVAAAAVVALGATALLPSGAGAQVAQYNGTLTAGTINVRVGDATYARTIATPDLAGTITAAFDDVANTFTASSTFSPYTAPNQSGPFGLSIRITIYLTQQAPFSGTTTGGGATFSGSGTVRLALKVEASSTPADPASWQTFATADKCFVDITMPVSGTVTGGTVSVNSAAFTIPSFPTGATGCDSVIGGTTISDEVNAQIPGQNNNAALTYVGQVTTTTEATTTTTSTTTTTAPTTTTTSTTQPTTTTENPNQTTTTVDGTTTTTEATTTTTEATTTTTEATTSTTQPTTTTTSGEGTTTTVPGTTSTTGIPVTLLPTTTTAPTVTTTPTTVATTTTGAVTSTPSTDTTVPSSETTAPDTATTAPSSETTVAGGDVSGNDASNGGTGSTAGGSLARTGSDTTGQAVLGGTLLTLGGALVLGARRRRLGDA